MSAEMRDEEWFDKEIKQMGKTQVHCQICDGTGKRTSPFTAIETTCFACKGTGRKKLSSSEKPNK